MRIVVQCHALRRSQGASLARELGASLLVFSQPPSVAQCRMDTASAIRFGAEIDPRDWLVRCEDDAVPVRNLAAALPGILGSAPGPVVTLYSNRAADPKSLAAGVRWRRQPYSELFVGVVMAVRGSLCAGLADHLEAIEGHWDSGIQPYLRSCGLHSYAHVPSLVQHRNDDSLLGHPSKPAGIPRQSRTFPGEQFDALSLI